MGESEKAPPLHVERSFVLPGVTPEQAWPWLGDTDGLNRLGGLPPVRSVIDSSPGGATRSSVRTVGMFPPMSWREGPFEFVRPRYHVVEREFQKGPLRHFRGGVRQEPQGDGTKVTIFATFRLRVGLLRLPGLMRSIVRWDARRRMKKMAERVQAAVAGWRDTGAPVYAPAPTPLVPGAEARLDAGLAGVRAAAPELADRIGALLREAPDLDALRLRPFAIADGWGVPRLDVLRALLHAARAGLVDLNWELLCPHCRLPTHQETALDELAPDARCEVCDYSFAAEFDETVEVTFAVARAIRAIEPVTFCLGSPARRDGVFVQAVLAPGETRSFEVDLPAGDYSVERADRDRATHLAVGEGPVKARLEVTDDGVAPENASLQAGTVELTVTRDGDVPVRISVGRRGPREDFASAALVTRLQDFRDLFSSQVLAPGVRMGIASITILFTDLRASTAMYEQLGDAPAYATIRDHFQVLADAAREHGGGIVKTIGDAVMAAFATPRDAVEAARAMRAAIAELNARPDAPQLVMKIGIHGGACIAVNANDRLDYFGRTVNLAARLSPLSDGHDIIVSRSAAAEIDDPDLRHEPFEADLKGLDRRSVVRLLPH